MHSCETYHILISALIDDEISPAERSELMAHIAECDDCKAYLDDQMLIHEAVQSMDCTAPVGFADGVMARVRETKQDLSQRKVVAFPLWKQIASLAACCAVIALGIFAVDGGILNMEASSDSAAPETAYITGAGTAAQTADNAADYDGGVPETPASVPPQAGAKAAPQAESEDNTNACAADSAETYTEYASITQFAARLTTDSAIARQWVSDTLGHEWVSGTYYFLTEEEFIALRELLTAAGEDFEEIQGTEGNQFYQLLAR